MKDLFATTSRLVEVKSGKAVLSPLQRITAQGVARPHIYANSFIAAGIGFAGGVAGAEAVKWLLKNYVRLTCDACGTEAARDQRFCPDCRARPAPRTEFWIGLGFAGAGVVILVLSLLTLRLDLAVIVLAGGLLGAGVDLVLDSLRANFSQPRPPTGMATG